MLLLTTLTLVAVLVGVLVGTVGVGGVLLAPALVLIAGADPHDATAISLVSFTATGAVSAALHLRTPDLPRRPLAALAPGLAIGAFLGGLTARRIPNPALLATLAAVSLFAALWTFARPATTRTRTTLPLPAAAPLGLLTGFGSAITGTSGPVLLTPTLMATGFATRAAIITGQIAQVLITPAGSIGYILQSPPDPRTTALLSTATAAGTALGIYLTRRLHLPDHLLRTLVATLLLATAALITLRLTLG